MVTLYSVQYLPTIFRRITRLNSSGCSFRCAGEIRVKNQLRCHNAQKKNIILISFPVLQHICGQRGCNNNSDNNNNNNGRKTAVKKQTNLHNMSHRETKRTPRVVGGQQNISGVFTFHSGCSRTRKRDTHAHTHTLWIGVKMLLGEVGPEK